MVPAVASGFSCSSTVDWRLEEQPYYPPTVNNDAMAAFAAEVCVCVCMCMGGGAGGQVPGAGWAAEVRGW